ncbi:MAG: hypothetical protein ACRCWG_12615 [Sarcina sp.]
MFAWIEQQHNKKIPIKLINKTEKVIEKIEVFYGEKKSVKVKKIKVGKEKSLMILPTTEEDGQEINVVIGEQKYLGLEKFEFSRARVVVIEITEKNGELDVLVEDKYNF